MMFSSGLRLDRGYYTQPLWAGLLCSGLYVMLTEGVQHRIGEWEGNVVGGLVAAAALLCLVASLLRNWRLAFRLEIVGLAVIVAAMVLLDFSVDLTLWDQMTYVGGLAAWVQIGSIRLIFDLWRALRTV